MLLTGLLARELGGGRRAEWIAAACTATGAVFLQTGHTLGTTTFDLLVWTGVTWLVVRALRTGDDRLWPVAGLVLGVGLLNKPLPAFLAAGLLVGVLIAGPPNLLRNRWVWAGVGAFAYNVARAATGGRRPAQPACRGSGDGAVERLRGPELASSTRIQISA